MAETKNKTLEEFISGVAKENESKNIRLGMHLAAVINAYYYKDLLAYLKGDDKGNGSMYFCNLKPLYDEYGYEKVNNALLEYDKEMSNNE